MRCMSIAVGSSTSAARCNRMPTWRWSRTACCAAAIDFGRPSVIGSTKPGNNTVLRTGTMISASGGKPGSVAPAADDALSFALICCSATVRSRFLQGDHEATGRCRAANAGIASRRQAQAPVEAPLRQFETMNRRATQLIGPRPGAGNDAIAVFDHRLGVVWIDSRQGDERQYFEFGLQDIDRRLPDRKLRLRGSRPKQLAMQAFGAREHFARFRPHPITGHVAGHRTPPNEYPSR